MNPKSARKRTRKKRNKMFKKIFYIIIVLILALGEDVISQETVYLKSGEFGRGILKERGGECFVIAPFHVIAESVEDTISVIGDKYVVSKAVFVQGFASDLAILRIVGGGQQYCAFWEVSEDFTDILDVSYEGYIDLRTEYGNTSKLQVYIKETGDGVITIEPKTNKGNFSKGMSGSSLFTTYQGKKIYLGMLQQVDDGKGLVLEADNSYRILQEFFEPNKEHKKLTTEEEKSIQTQKREFLKKEFEKHIQFINDHFKELQNANAKHLTIKFQSFLLRMNDIYSEYPPELNLPSQDKYRYLDLISDITIQIETCKKIIDKNPDSWDTLATPHISMMLIYLEDLLALVTKK
jgi:hypothetical protein